jgi:CheY-like chemotaxis protein
VSGGADGRDMLRTILAMQGHEVHEAADGSAAIITALDIRPDVAIIDIGLPGIDGYAVAAHMRQDARTQRTRLIALTGYGTEEDRKRAADAGFDAHMTKPIDPEQLARLLAEA